MNKIILSTLNARYSHTSIALRYLYANLNEIQNITTIKEYVINENVQEIAERILSEKPVIIGFGVYIWNASDIKELVDVIKKVAPEIFIVLGGPEVSHLPLRVDLSNADYIIQGEGEIEFYKLCKSLLNNESPNEKFIKANPVYVDEIKLPYKYYTDHDIENRVVYVEASRGCPFTCEFCLSSIDKSVRYFDLENILNEFEILWQRGARKFKFIDRTFNLNIQTANKILDFFLQKKPPYLIHFEVIPDNFPNAVKEKLKLFPPASIQLEIGIQTLNNEIADNINRKLNINKIKENIKFLEAETDAHLHVDLIIGLPGESIESFAVNLDSLAAITNSEIQIGVLKKLSGTTLSRHDKIYGQVYSDIPPYEILKNDLISFDKMQKLKRFARYWDITYNSGNFKNSIRLLWQNGNVYKGFYDFAEWIFTKTEATHQISLNRMTELLFQYLSDELKLNKNETADIIARDLLKVSGRKLPKFLKEFLTEVPEVQKNELANINKRQLRHLN